MEDVKDIYKFKVGDSASVSRTISKQDVVKMAQLTGDYNPIHIDENYASKTAFKKCIAHGLFCEGLISALLGTTMPGEGTVIVSQSFWFRKPVFISDMITATVKISDIDYEKNKILLASTCVNQDNMVVLDGESYVLFFPVI